MAEVDINPLIVGPDGWVTAVDALVVLGDKTKPVAGQVRRDLSFMDAMLAPKSIAIVGAKRARTIAGKT